MDDTEEEFVSEEEADAGPMAIKSLREKLKAAVGKSQEYLEGWQRARADLANYKREEGLLHTSKEARIKAELLEELLPALDVLELSVRHLPAQAGEEASALKMLEAQFLGSLKKIGVSRFGAVGEDFDPRKHEALAKRGEDHKIESVERSGYSVGDTIIRPAQVII